MTVDELKAAIQIEHQQGDAPADDFFDALANMVAGAVIREAAQNEGKP